MIDTAMGLAGIFSGVSVASKLKLADAQTVVATTGADNAPTGPALRAQLAGTDIAGGQTPAQFAEHIANVILNYNSYNELDHGRRAYWHEPMATLVIRDPKRVDGGTAFRPDSKRQYFDNLKDRNVK